MLDEEFSGIVLAAETRRYTQIKERDESSLAEALREIEKRGIIAVTH